MIFSSSLKTPAEVNSENPDIIFSPPSPLQRASFPLGKNGLSSFYDFRRAKSNERGVNDTVSGSSVQSPESVVIALFVVGAREC